MDDQLWTAEEVATLLQVSEGTVNQWVKSGRIPVVKVGRLNRFNRADIEAWLDENKRSAEGSGVA
jgi:excisionase family DNA binding protein